MAGFGGGCHWAAKPDRLQTVLCCRPPGQPERQQLAVSGDPSSRKTAPRTGLVLAGTEAKFPDAGQRPGSWNTSTLRTRPDEPGQGLTVDRLLQEPIEGPSLSSGLVL